jgi:hypothetical protein
VITIDHDQIKDARRGATTKVEELNRGRSYVLVPGPPLVKAKSRLAAAQS